ncbi:MAG: hypothetical protein H6839_00475 [Planctomycetes bacterium]|nr:hypothetical protein [Planctomycetota bacterium]
MKAAFTTEVLRAFDKDTSFWGDDSREAVKRDIHRLWDEVAGRRDIENVSLRQIDYSELPKTLLIGQRYFIAPSRRPGICVGTSSPYWKFGWKDTLKTNFGDGLLRDFMISCSIHVTRNAYVSAMLFLWRATATVPDLRNSWEMQEWNHVGHHFPDVDRSALNKATIAYEVAKLAGGNDRSLVLWDDVGPANARLSKHATLIDDEVNVLDLDVHRMAYHLVRAALLSTSFVQEAVVALAAVVDAGKALFERRGEKITTEGLCYRIGAPYSLAAEIDRLERVRDRLCAHRAFAVWWDFGSIYGDQVDDWLDVVWRVFRFVCKWERENRETEPFPEDWSDWWQENAVHLWRSLGYGDLP